ncbi:transcription antitermination factor NusB [Hydrogenibacillus sp. N12]|uniref:transcription antitermination factor NusB n=1 Tax=Hydrogenibacillus sp. N12 TaxID=2866627 RepID=UPI001C7D56C2|nr:transcription antitermination factor NusB [Hydrogenibacillus sp. N12]QZA32034.1 transcription antitermination factor NusB [Hydrogenibacillus sp. N12]
MQRRTARELALKALYQIDLAGATPEAAFEALGLEPDEGVYARALVAGVLREQAVLDRLIVDHLVGWRLERIPVIDRAILRLGLYELLYVDDVPPKVALDEAVELAKRYSDERARVYINGLLSRVFRERFGEAADAEGDAAAAGEPSRAEAKPAADGSSRAGAASEDGEALRAEEASEDGGAPAGGR